MSTGFHDEYLGDGVYASWDGYGVWLDVRAQHFMSRTPGGHDGICLEPEVIVRLVAYHKRMTAAQPTRDVEELQ